MKNLLVTIFLLITLSKGDIFKTLEAYESELKTVTLNFEKSWKHKRSDNCHKANKTKYFKIVSPQYETRTDTIHAFDPFKFKKEMAVLYEVGHEYYLLKKGSFRWIYESSKINLCESENQFELLKKNQVRLKYQKTANEYTVVPRLYLKTAPNHRPTNHPSWQDKSILEERRKKNLKAIELAKEGKYKFILESHVLISHGSIEEVTLKEIEKEYIPKEHLLIFEKGNWNISQEKKVEQKCEPNIENIQIALRRLGYDTNIDGQLTTRYKHAKNLFLKESNVLNANEEVFLKKLGW